MTFVSDNGGVTNVTTLFDKTYVAGFAIEPFTESKVVMFVQSYQSWY